MSGNRLTPIPESWLQPIQQLVALYEEYGSLPRAIFGLISLYIVNGVLNIGEYIVSSILLLFDYVTGSLGLVQRQLGVSFATVSAGVLTAIWNVQMSIATIVTPYGPLTPVVMIGLTAIEALIIWRILVALLGELPLGSSITDLLGLR